jgi:hypothetical protein
MFEKEREKRRKKEMGTNRWIKREKEGKSERKWEKKGRYSGKRG